ncbi:hypothetical protein ACLOJK_015419, partial [Asimina triloba]
MAAGGELATAANTVPILCLLPSDGEQHAHPSDQRLRFKSGQSTIIFIRRSSIQTHHARLATTSTLLGDNVHAPRRQPPKSNGQVPSSSTPLPPEPAGHDPAANTQNTVFLPFSPSDAVHHQWPTDPATIQPSDPASTALPTTSVRPFLPDPASPSAAHDALHAPCVRRAAVRPPAHERARQPITPI